MKFTKGAYIILLSFIIVSVLNGCQSKEYKKHLPPPVNIEISLEEIKKTIEELSSPDFAGRRAGSEGEAEAALFIAQRLKELNLVPLGENSTYFQAFPLPQVDLRSNGKRTEFYLMGGESTLKGDNVLGGLISRERPEKFILLSAHYDHLGTWQDNLYPGANDNCSGVSVLLELARVLKEEELPYSIIFSFWSGEEMGLIGSNHFVNNPTIPLEKIRLNINLDSVGLGKNKEFLIWTAGPQDITQEVVSHWSKWEDFIIKEEYSIEHSSDHKTIAKGQIPALTILAQDWLIDNHTPHDIPGKINYEKLKNLTTKIMEYLQSEEIESLLTS